MKTTLLLFFSILSFQFTFSQNITFTDPNLKNFLINSSIDFVPDFSVTYPPIDLNNDDEISIEEALLVRKLNFYYTDLVNLEGLQFFTNLKVIETFFANFETFNLPTLVNLEELLIQNIATEGILTNLNLSGNVNLKKLNARTIGSSLDLSNNINLTEVSIFCPNLTSFNLSNLNKLKSLTYYGKMQTIDLSDCTNLLTLSCYGNSPTFPIGSENLLTSIDLTNQTKLVNLLIAGNELSSINLSNCPNLELVDVSYNNLTSLNIDNSLYIKILYCDNNNITSLNLNNQFNIQNVSCRSNQLTTLSLKNGIIEEYFDFFGNPDLSTVCCDTNEIVYIQNQCYINGNDTVVVNSSCITIENKIPLVMYPNPAKDVLHLDSSEKINKIEIFGSNGLLIMASDSVSDVVDIQKLQSGIYFLKVYRDGDVSQMKFMKG